MDKRTPTPLRTVNVRLDDELNRWVDAEAKRRRCSLAQVIRELVAAAADARGAR